jgi:hypothetical protein
MFSITERDGALAPDWAAVAAGWAAVAPGWAAVAAGWAAVAPGWAAVRAGFGRRGPKFPQQQARFMDADRPDALEVPWNLEIEPVSAPLRSVMLNSRATGQ